MPSRADDVTASVFSLYRKYGQADYLGESVSQLAHATQCAMWADSEDGSTEAILGAFLHDVGHLVGQDTGLENMVTGDVVLGIQDHDVIGEKFLLDLGVPSSVTEFVLGHVQAKRYLTFKRPEHYDKLSEASRMTLVHQGDRMTAEEAAVFESNPRHEALIRMRTWDEKAKDPAAEMPPLEKYETMFREFMEKIFQEKQQ